MSPTTPQNTDAITLIEREIIDSENERRPLSRQMLAELVNQRTGMPVADAFTLVDGYCDDKAPRIPHYLQEEFAIPYLKVIAAINIAITLGVYYWGIQVSRKGLPAWMYFTVGTLFLGLSALSWVKSLERYAERKAKSRRS